MDQKTKEQKKLPDGYDVVGEYQDNIEQSLVDNLFDYFGRVYYKNHSLNGGTKDQIRLRNSYLSKYDKKIFKLINKKFVKYSIATLIILLLTIAGFLLFYFLVGGDYNSVINKADSLAQDPNLLINDQNGWLILFLVVFVSICLLGILGIVLLFITITWYTRSNRQYNRIIRKNKMWNRSFYNFATNLSEKGVLNAIQASIPYFVVDKHTPTFDKSIYNIHNRIYSYANIPQDARRIKFGCLSSGFYRGNAYSLSYSSWEWFREAKVIDQNKLEGNKINIHARRSLRRFEDSICVLTVDTFAEPKLNFVLNNPDGKNIRLQNKIFNNVFSLAVNNPDLAYTVFTPYVQHTLARCKTWTDSSRGIRQVIKEGSKVYVVFDGKEDFFKFSRVIDPRLNYVFNSVEARSSVLLAKQNRLSDVSPNELLKLGSLDETASLMTEYILEEVDIMFTALEMATCYPMDNIIVKKQKHARSLYDVLEEKRNNPGLRFKTLSQLDEKFDEVNKKVDEIGLRQQAPLFRPMVNIEGVNNNRDSLDKTLKI